MTLMASLRRLLGVPPAPKAKSPPAPGVADTPAVAPVDAGADDGRASAAQRHGAGGVSDVRFGADADRRFSAMLLGLGELRRAGIEPSEQRVIDQLEQLADHRGDPNLLPRLPVVLPRLIGLVRRDDVSSRELAENLSRDPTLVGEVVRIANSPRYRTTREIGSVQEAVTMLGQRGLVQLVIQAAMRPIFDNRQGRFSRIAGSLPLDLTERCAHASARLGGTDPFQAYLAGMVVNLGLIPALRMLDRAYQEPNPPDTEGFHDALAATTSRLSAQMAGLWELPPDVCMAVRRCGGHRIGPAEDALTGCLRTAVRAAKWQLMRPGLSGDTLAGLNADEQGCYLELERAFGP
jgi:HD-like signal output (HDOD) protein